MSRAEEPGRDSSPFRSTGFIAAAAFLVVVVVLAAAVVIRRERTSPEATPTAGPPPTAAPRTGGGQCRLSDTGQHIPTTGPPATWTVFKSIAVPASAVAGPGVTEGQHVRCFARTPTGALIASWQLYIRTLLSDDWRRVVDEQVMPGPGREAYTRARSQITGDVSNPGGYGQLAGFKFVTYTPDIAVIQLVLRLPSGQYRVVTHTVMWSEGDWRLQLQPDGNSSPNGPLMDSLEGFTHWGGV